MKFNKNIILGNFQISPDSPTYIIAEIGVNHGGDLGLAKKMIDSAKESGANAVKFQTFKAERLVSPDTPKVEYQMSTTEPRESHFDMIKSLEVSENDHYKIIEYCKQIGIEFISTPYDIKSAEFLQTCDVKLFKTASADIVDLEMHQFLAKSGKPVILATGMSSLGEVENAIELYIKANNVNIMLLHCVSNYPCSPESLNLRVIQTLQQAFQTIVGYSDHSIGHQAACLSVALGACIIEKHFTIDKNLPGPDHKASSTPTEFKVLVDAVRTTEQMLGIPIKQCQDEEREMSYVSRKSIVLNRNLQAGKIIQREDLTLKRPGTGLGAVNLTDLIGKKTRKSLNENHVIAWTDVQD